MCRRVGRSSQQLWPTLKWWQRDADVQTGSVLCSPPKQLPKSEAPKPSTAMRTCECKQARRLEVRALPAQDVNQPGLLAKHAQQLAFLALQPLDVAQRASLLTTRGVAHLLAL